MKSKERKEAVKEIFPDLDTYQDKVRSPSLSSVWLSGYDKSKIEI